MSNFYPACIPISLEKYEESFFNKDFFSYLKNIGFNSKDYIELYCDVLNTSEANAVVDLIHNELNCKIIITNRLARFKKTKKNINEQIEFIKSLDDMFDYLDADIDHEQYLLDVVKKDKLVLSSHSYDKSYSFHELKNLSERMIQFYPAVIKIAITCIEKEDVNTLENTLLFLKSKNLKFSISPMGELGFEARKRFAALGVSWTYVSLTKNLSTASGQLTLEEFCKFRDV